MPTQQRLTGRLNTSSTVSVFTLASREIAEHWDLIVPFLEFGVFEWTPEFVKEELIAARAQLWGLAEDGEIRGIVITTIQNTPHTWGLLWIASGKGLKAGIEMLLEHIEPWLFGEKGCHFIQIIGREGFAMLPGYKATARVFTKVRQ